MNEVKKLNPFVDLLERHIDDAAFLWVLRSVAVDQPQYGLAELKKLETRIDKHLAAMMLSLDSAWELAESAAELEGPGEAFVLTMLAFHSMEVERIQKVTELCIASKKMLPGFVSALAWMPAQLSTPWVDKFLKSKTLEHKTIAIWFYSLTRQNPGEYLFSLFTRKDCLSNIPLYTRALRLIGEIKRRDLIPVLNQAVESKNETVTFWALWSLALLGNRAVAEKLKHYVFNEGPLRSHAIDVAIRCLDVSTARAWISELSKIEGATRIVIKASAALGDPQVVPWLLDKMKTPKLARAAGEAFVAITGIDLEYHKLTSDAPDLFEESEDENSDLDEFSLEDANLVWPNSEKITEAWRSYGTGFKPGVRFFLGKQVDANLLQAMLISGGQRQRHAAALELALLLPDQVYVNTQATIVGDLIGDTNE